MMEFGEITLESRDDGVHVTKPPPPVIGISEELLTMKGSKWLRASGGEIFLDVLPEKLHYRCVGKSIMHPGVWIAERVEDEP